MYNLCSANDSLKRVKRQITDWKKIFANIISEKGLISSIYKELSKLNSLKFLRKKWAKEKENILPQRVYEWQISK